MPTRSSAPGIEDDVSGHKDVERPLGIAPHSDRYQRDHQGIDDATGDPGIETQLPQQFGLGVQEQVVGEHSADPEHEKAQRGARCRSRAAKDVLGQNQRQQGNTEPGTSEQQQWFVGTDSQTLQGSESHSPKKHRRPYCGCRQAGRFRDEWPRQPCKNREPRAAAHEFGDVNRQERKPQRRSLDRQYERPQSARQRCHDDASTRRASAPADEQQQRQQQERQRCQAIACRPQRHADG